MYNCNLVDVPVEQAYEEIFGESLARYNEGKRPSRQISNYLEYLRKQEREGQKEGKKNVRHPEYEYVGQIGNRESGFTLKWNEYFRRAEGDMAMREKLLNIFQEFLQEFRVRYPSLYITGFQIHFDEPNGTPHFHIRFIPVAHGYKIGMDTQCSLTKALEECGFKKTDRRHEMSITDFRHACMDLIEEIALKYGIKREDMGNKNKHIPNGIYQQMMREKSQKEEEIKQDLARKQEKANETISEINTREIGAKLKLMQTEEKVNALEKKYKAMEEAPPEIKVIEKEVEKIVEVKKEVIVEVPTELNYKEKYLQFNDDVSAFVKTIEKLPDELKNKILDELPPDQAQEYFKYYGKTH